MGLYDAFRVNGAPTFYEAVHTPVEADLVEAGLIFCFAILAASFFIILPGIRGIERLFIFIRITVSLFIGGVILVTNFAATWEVAKISTHTKYKAGTGHEISADIAVNVALRGINITLKGTPEVQLNETINYNEHFSWEWRQGRPGFGPFAGRFNQEYREAQFRGLPLPILWVAEYFTVDGEGIRWGRHYRQAGWYSHIVLWFAFPLWIVSNILFFVLLRYGAYFLALTGAAMITTNIIWATIRNPLPLKIPFSDKDILEFSFGGSFIICLITGILCVVLSLIIFLMDLRYPQQIATFFSVDVLQDSEEVQVEKEEPVVDAVNETEDEDEDKDQNEKSGRNGASADAKNEDDEIYEINIHMPEQMRGPSRRFTQRFQKPRRRQPPPPPSTLDEPDNDYVNMPDEVYENRGAIGKRAPHKPAAVRLSAIKTRVEEEEE